MKVLEAAEKPIMGSEARCNFQIFLPHFCLTCLLLTVCHWEMGGDGGVYCFWAVWLNQRGVAPRCLKLHHNRQRRLFLPECSASCGTWSGPEAVLSWERRVEESLVRWGWALERSLWAPTQAPALLSVLSAPATRLEPRENSWSRMTHLCLARFLTQKLRHTVKVLLLS